MAHYRDNIGGVVNLCCMLWEASEEPTVKENWTQGSRFAKAIRQEKVVLVQVLLYRHFGV